VLAERSQRAALAANEKALERDLVRVVEDAPVSNATTTAARPPSAASSSRPSSAAGRTKAAATIAPPLSLPAITPQPQSKPSTPRTLPLMPVSASPSSLPGPVSSLPVTRSPSSGSGTLRDSREQQHLPRLPALAGPEVSGRALSKTPERSQSPQLSDEPARATDAGELLGASAPNSVFRGVDMVERTRYLNMQRERLVAHLRAEREAALDRHMAELGRGAPVEGDGASSEVGRGDNMGHTAAAEAENEQRQALRRALAAKLRRDVLGKEA
jgi:hypothetical protein